jgi:putative Mg2+ transporter-C (MgtC) family protein
MFLNPEDLLKIALAILVGGLVGLEREFRDKAAGFRTLIFISLGAALFTIFSVKLAGDKDPTRIAANIVSGVGFLGAGVILREGGKVVGLTTAATIWLAAALGMGIGGAQYALTGLAVILILVVLWVFPRFEHWLDRLQEERTYDVTCTSRPGKYLELEETFCQSGLRIRTHRRAKTAQGMLCSWQAAGTMQAHERLVEHLLADEEILEFKF